MAASPLPALHPAANHSLDTGCRVLALLSRGYWPVSPPSRRSGPRGPRRPGCRLRWASGRCGHRELRAGRERPGIGSVCSSIDRSGPSCTPAASANWVALDCVSWTAGARAATLSGLGVRGRERHALHLQRVARRRAHPLQHRSDLTEARHRDAQAVARLLTGHPLSLLVVPVLDADVRRVDPVGRNSAVAEAVDHLRRRGRRSHSSCRPGVLAQ